MKFVYPVALLIYTSLILLPWIVYSPNVNAQLDLSFRTQGRTYPGIGAEAIIESGYNYLLWGEGKRSNPLYGLIRPSIFTSTSIVINSYGAEIGFYPISFLGIEKGFRNIQSDFQKFNFYNCEEVRCNGNLQRNYTTYKLALGYKNFLATSRIQISDNQYSHAGSRGKAVGEFRFAILANPEEDSYYFSQYALAWKATELKGIIGIAQEKAKFQDSGMQYQSTFLLYSTRIEKETWLMGLGNFQSDHVEKGVVFYLRWNYQFLPTMKLF